VKLALYIETTLADTKWTDLSGINNGYLLRGIVGNRPTYTMNSGQISRVFNSLVSKAGPDPKQNSGHSTRIGAAQDWLDSGVSIG